MDGEPRHVLPYIGTEKQLLCSLGYTNNHDSLAIVMQIPSLTAV